MNTRQISVFLENKKGRLASITNLLAESGVNMEASSLADIGEFGVLHFIPDKYDLAWETLTKAGFSICETNIIIFKVSHEPGSLAKILNLIEENEINVEYMYALPQVVEGKALLLFRFFDHDNAVKLLSSQNLEIYKVSPD